MARRSDANYDGCPIVTQIVDNTPNPFRPPRWAWALIISLALIDPLSHGVIMLFPPEGTVPTQGHVVDTFNYLTAMKYAHPPWYSPYNLCDSPYAAGDPTLYAIPHHHLFGAIGTVGNWLRMPPFYMMALANGLGLFFYLFAAYTFLVSSVPRLAHRAFLLFCLGGGLGGILYLLTWPFGVHTHPQFGEYFLRYFIYELSEGPRFQPWLMAARLYYTLAFGFGFLALTTLWHAMARDRKALLALAAFLFACTALANFRVGPMLWGAAVIILFCRAEWSWTRRIAWAASLLVGVALGGGIAVAMVARNPELLETVARSARLALWFSPIVSATFFYWLLIPGTVLRTINRAPQWLRYAGWGATGYIAAFAVLYCLYQAYYGNFLRTGEFHVAVKMSDYALLLGVPVAFAIAWWKGPAHEFGHDGYHPPGPLGERLRFSEDTFPPAKAIEPLGAQVEDARWRAARLQGSSSWPEPVQAADGSAMSTYSTAPPWAALWLLAFFALSFSAWGQGWFLKYTPDRFIIVIGVPLAILGAAAIERGLLRQPRLYRALQRTIILCGVVSILVTWLVSYGPLGYHTLQQHYSWTRNAFMNQADADTLAHLKDGVVLAPSLGAPLMGDLAVMQGNATVHGIGSVDYPRHVANDVRAQVADFYRPETPNAIRREMVEKWCVRYVYCPDTDPVAPETVAQLRASGWLREVAANEKAVLFEVNNPE